MTRGGAMRLITMCFIRIGVRGSLALSLLAVAALRAAPPKQTFTGTITDSMCAKADHSQMQMGPTDAACTMACVSVHGAAYVLYDGKNTYTLNDQRTPEKFAGQKVKVIGTLDAKTKTIQADSITAAK
ncbi:MAG: hypothetical protein DMG31_14730 [Acidobacteria bacterium]|nr:MAG: hypothetical protein DMG31_14730 [Acidobacteriota bacterium]